MKLKEQEGIEYNHYTLFQKTCQALFETFLKNY